MNNIILYDGTTVDEITTEAKKHFQSLEERAWYQYRGGLISMSTYLKQVDEYRDLVNGITYDSVMYLEKQELADIPW